MTMYWVFAAAITLSCFALVATLTSVLIAAAAPALARRLERYAPCVPRLAALSSARAARCVRVGVRLRHRPPDLPALRAGGRRRDARANADRHGHGRRRAPGARRLPRGGGPPRDRGGDARLAGPRPAAVDRRRADPGLRDRGVLPDRRGRRVLPSGALHRRAGPARVQRRTKSARWCCTSAPTSRIATT